jgi:hypothetical protein
MSAGHTDTHDKLTGLGFLLLRLLVVGNCLVVGRAATTLRDEGDARNALDTVCKSELTACTPCEPSAISHQPSVMHNCQLTLATAVVLLLVLLVLVLVADLVI